MTLEEFKKDINSNTNVLLTGKEKFRSYQYYCLDLNNQIDLLEEIINYSHHNLNAIKKQIANVFVSIIYVVSDFAFPLNTKEFSLDEFKSRVRLTHVKENSKNEYLLAIKHSIFEMNKIIHANMTSQKDLSSMDKMILINNLYEVVVKLILLTDAFGLSVDILFEEKVEEFKIEHKEIEKIEDKKQ